MCVCVRARNESVSLTCCEGAENIDELFVKRILIQDTCTPNATALTHKYFQFQLKKFVRRHLLGLVGRSFGRSIWLYCDLTPMSDASRYS